MAIIGRVNDRKEIVVYFSIVSDNAEHDVEALLDTGFNGSVALPDNLISECDLLLLGREKVILADGTSRIVRKYEAGVRFAGKARRVEVVGAGESLIGMSMLWTHAIHIPCVANGNVEMIALESE